MTTYWCYFSRIIVYNLVTIYGIATKFGIGMHPYPNFQCTKFQGNLIMHLCFITTFTPLRKVEEKKKNEETKPIFEGSYQVRFSWNLKCEVVTLAGISNAKIVLFLHIRENCIFVLPVNNSLVWRAGFLGCTTHYRVSWYLGNYF